MEYETQAIFAGLEAGLDDRDEEVRRICAWGLCHWDSMTADRVRVVLRRLGQVDSGLAEFLAYRRVPVTGGPPRGGGLPARHVAEEGHRPLRSAAAVRLGRLKVDDAAVLADLFRLPRLR